jgi:hypothetical protein
LVYFELHLLLELYPLLLLNHHPVQIVDLRFRPADKGNAGIGLHSVVDRTLLRVRTLPDATFPRALLRGSATAHPRQIAIVCARLGSSARAVLSKGPPLARAAFAHASSAVTKRAIK